MQQGVKARCRALPGWPWAIAVPANGSRLNSEVRDTLRSQLERVGVRASPATYTLSHRQLVLREIFVLACQEPRPVCLVAMHAWNAASIMGRKPVTFQQWGRREGYSIAVSDGGQRKFATFGFSRSIAASANGAGFPPSRERRCARH